MNYTTFQRGTLVKRPNAKGGFTWTLRYMDGEAYKAKRLGTNAELPTEKDAWRKASTLNAVINRDNPDGARTFAQLCERYVAEELPLRPQTASSYKSAIRHLRAKFDDVQLDRMFKDIIGIENWLRDLKTFPTKPKIAPAAERLVGRFTIPGRPARPLSMKSKQNIKATMHRLITCAMKWNYLEFQANPVATVEIKRPKFGTLPPKRLKVPLSLNQIWSLLKHDELTNHVKTMITLCVFNGLRISEVLGLQWEDIDFNAVDGPVMSIVRSSVGKHIDETKSETSKATMPVHPYVAQVLEAWKASSTSRNGWLFENEMTGRPFHRDSLQADHLAPAGKAIGIVNLGWHSFRHSHRAFHRALGTDPETQMLVMRHADISQTMDYGADDQLLGVKRPAINALAELLLKAEGEK